MIGVILGLAVRARLLERAQHVIRQTNKESTKLTLLLVTDLGQDELEIGTAEVGWILLDGLEIGVGPDSVALSIRGWNDSDEWTRVIPDHLEKRELTMSITQEKTRNEQLEPD